MRLMEDKNGVIYALNVGRTKITNETLQGCVIGKGGAETVLRAFPALNLCTRAAKQNGPFSVLSLHVSTAS